MSFCYDVLERVFAHHIKPQLKDSEISMRFEMLLSEMHEANHRLRDAINKDEGVNRVARKLDQAMSRAQAEADLAHKAQAEALAQRLKCPLRACVLAGKCVSDDCSINKAESFALRVAGQEVHKVSCRVNGKLQVCSPDFNSRGAAQAYADGINSGARKPEFSGRQPDGEQVDG